MTTRRSFFTRLAQFAAVVAIAPQIAFGRKPLIYPGCFSVPEMVDAFDKAESFWILQTRWTKHNWPVNADPVKYRRLVLGEWVSDWSDVTTNGKANL